MGYTVSGPILKDKLFFFTDLETHHSAKHFAREYSDDRTAGFCDRPQQEVDFQQHGNNYFRPSVEPRSGLAYAVRKQTLFRFSRIDLAAIELIKRMPPCRMETGFTNNFTAKRFS